MQEDGAETAQATDKTLLREVAAMERPLLQVISVMGGLTRGSDLKSFEITPRLADLLGARHCYFTTPLYAGSGAPRDTIIQLDVCRALLAGAPITPQSRASPRRNCCDCTRI